MIIWGALILPFLIILVGYLFFKDKVAWWEPLTPFLPVLLLIIMFKGCSEYTETRDTEYWGSYVTHARYFEPWNEWIHKTCSDTYPCGTDSKGNTKYCTRYYDCSYCKEHSAYWEVYGSGGESFTVPDWKFEQLKQHFGGNVQFVDMHRKYHTRDGDAYETRWMGEPEKFELIASTHSYENRVQASNNVINFPEVTDTVAKEYKLYDYPKIKDWYDLPTILTTNYTDSVRWIDEQKFKYINAMLGKEKQLRLWVLLFDDPRIEVAKMQEDYWKGGNKNEFVIMISANKYGELNWAHIMSWTTNEALKIEVRNYIYDQKELNLWNLGTWLYPTLKEKFVRRPFKEFSYLSVEPSTGYVITTYIISTILCVCIFIFIIKNEYNSNHVIRINRKSNSMFDS